MVANYGLLKGMNSVTTLLSMAIIMLFVLAGVFFTEQTSALFNSISGWILDTLNGITLALLPYFYSFVFGWPLVVMVAYD